jgi:cytochrome c-type biogenesis protein
VEIANISVLAALVAGSISFLSPCVLPLVPGYLSYVAGSLPADADSPRGRASAFVMSVWFVLGFSTVFVVLGAGASALSRMLLSYRYEAGLIGGVIIVGFGILTTGLVRAPWMEREFRLSPQIAGGRPGNAYVLGLAFAFGWTPCIGPILGAILTVSATSTTPAAGVALLAIYSLGLAIPFLLTALLASHARTLLRRLRRFGRVLQIFAGLTMVAMGLAMMTGRLSSIAFWLLETFPILALIG